MWQPLEWSQDFDVTVCCCLWARVIKKSQKHVILAFPCRSTPALYVRLLFLLHNNGPFLFGSPTTAKTPVLIFSLLLVLFKWSCYLNMSTRSRRHSKILPTHHRQSHEGAAKCFEWSPFLLCYNCYSSLASRTRWMKLGFYEGQRSALTLQTYNSAGWW